MMESFKSIGQLVCDNLLEDENKLDRPNFSADSVISKYERPLIKETLNEDIFDKPTT